MDETLKVTDRWCCHTRCPHVGETYSCIDCKTEHMKERGIPVERESVVEPGEEHRPGD